MSAVEQNSSRGILLMVLAMAAFAIADMFIKFTAGTLSSAHTTLLLIGGSLVVFIALAKMQGQQLWDKSALSRVLLIRYVAEIMATLGIVQAIALVPLSTLGAILQATPLVAAAGAVLLLGERVSWRRWSAIVVGFAGVMLIVKPGATAFDVNVLWAVLAMFALSARDLTTRATPSGMPSSTLAAYTMIAATPFALLWVLLTESRVLPDNANWWNISGMVGFATVGYLMIIASIRVAPVSVVSPFRYFRLLFLLLLGVFVFDEQPDVTMLGGALLIIVSGLYAMRRERQMQRLAQNSDKNMHD